MKVSDLTVDELKNLIRQVVAQTILETMEDPDQGLQIREEVESALTDSTSYVDSGGSTKSASQIAAELGLEW